jgi:hypothetical protein
VSIAKIKYEQTCHGKAYFKVHKTYTGTSRLRKMQQQQQQQQHAM